MKGKMHSNLYISPKIEIKMIDFSFDSIEMRSNIMEIKFKFSHACIYGKKRKRKFEVEGKS